MSLNDGLNNPSLSPLPRRIVDLRESKQNMNLCQQWLAKSSKNVKRLSGFTKCMINVYYQNEIGWNRWQYHIKLTIKILVAENAIEKYRGQNIKEFTSDRPSQCGEKRKWLKKICSPRHKVLDIEAYIIIKCSAL